MARANARPVKSRIKMANVLVASVSIEVITKFENGCI